MLYTWSATGQINGKNPSYHIKSFLRHYQWQNSGHGDTTDEFPVLSMAFRQAYTIESLHWPLANNDPCPAGQRCKPLIPSQ